MITEENEKKRVISAEEYTSLLQYFTVGCKPVKITQINYYYETESFDLHKKGDTLRVRQINNGLKLEYKYDKTTISGVRNCKELTRKVECIPKTIVFSNDTDVVYKNIGFMVTERANFIFDDTTVSLDKSYYLGIVDYEIEVESDNPALLPDVILKLNLDFSMNAEGKYTRLVKRLMNQECQYEI